MYFTANYTIALEWTFKIVVSLLSIMCDEIIYIMNNFYTQKILIVFFSERFIALERQTVHLWLHPISVLRYSELTDIQFKHSIRCDILQQQLLLMHRYLYGLRRWQNFGGNDISYMSHTFCVTMHHPKLAPYVRKKHRGVYMFA